MNKTSYLDLVPPEIGARIDVEVEKTILWKIVSRLNFLCLTKVFHTESPSGPFGDPECIFPQSDFEGIKTLSGLLQYQTDTLYAMIQGDEYKHYLSIKHKVKEYPLPYVFSLPTSPSEDWVPTQEDFTRARTKIESLGGRDTMEMWFRDHWEKYNFGLDDEGYDEDIDFIREFENNLLSTIFPLCDEFHPAGKSSLRCIFIAKVISGLTQNR